MLPVYKRLGTYQHLPCRWLVPRGRGEHPHPRTTGETPVQREEDKRERGKGQEEPAVRERATQIRVAPLHVCTRSRPKEQTAMR